MVVGKRDHKARALSRNILSSKSRNVFQTTRWSELKTTTKLPTETSWIQEFLRRWNQSGSRTSKSRLLPTWHESAMTLSTSGAQQLFRRHQHPRVPWFSRFSRKVGTNAISIIDHHLNLHLLVSRGVFRRINFSPPTMFLFLHPLGLRPRGFHNKTILTNKNKIKIFFFLFLQYSYCFFFGVNTENTLFYNLLCGSRVYTFK